MISQMPSIDPERDAFSARCAPRRVAQTNFSFRSLGNNVEMIITGDKLTNKVLPLLKTYIDMAAAMVAVNGRGTSTLTVTLHEYNRYHISINYQDRKNLT